MKSKTEILSDLLKEYNLKPETYLYRYTSMQHLHKDNDGLQYLKAKEEPMDMVVDRYDGNYHVFIAHEIGKGLSFLSKPEREYEIPGRICVRIKLSEVLNQKGLVYPVSSLPAYIKAFFCTMPDGKVKVELE